MTRRLLDNPRSWWRRHDGGLDDAPRDGAERFAPAPESKAESAPISARYRGWPCCAMDYSRAKPAPVELFPWHERDND